ncbi:MAG TPA: prolipoprotein diacylglyceryl transferase family protein, partial [Myxococcaceae bacterium]|nr:prolipoprotein diacylglyceryl transferase family protein [Myxococcaceae bacterium]
LYDMLVLLALTGVLYTLARVRRPDGFLMGILGVGYSASRFFLDFLRASDLSYVDSRYFGLTPGQYVVIGLFLCGVYLLVTARGTVGKPVAASSSRAGRREAETASRNR